MIKVGDQAPHFSLLDTSKAQVQLSDFQGQKLVIAFYPAAFTGVCKAELCSFQESLSQFNALSAQVVGISVDGPFANGAFASSNDIRFPLLSDYQRETVQAYGVLLENFAGMPGYTAAQRSVFIIDEAGTVSYAWVAENPGIEPNYAEVKAALV